MWWQESECRSYLPFSKRLARLEQRLGSQLIRRTTRRLTLTEVGEAFYERVVAILAAVREGAGERAAQLIDHLKKGDMAKEAERLLADSGWLPEPLRLVEQDEPATNGEGDEALPAFLADDDEPSDDEDEVLHVVAAE
mgnify:CR=1 FL=1